MVDIKTLTSMEADLEQSRLVFVGQWNIASNMRDAAIDAINDAFWEAEKVAEEARDVRDAAIRAKYPPTYFRL